MLKLAILKAHFRCKERELVDFDIFVDFDVGNNCLSAGGNIGFHHVSNAGLICA